MKESVVFSRWVTARGICPLCGRTSTKLVCVTGVGETPSLAVLDWYKQGLCVREWESVNHSLCERKPTGDKLF